MKIQSNKDHAKTKLHSRVASFFFFFGMCGVAYFAQTYHYYGQLGAPMLIALEYGGRQMEVVGNRDGDVLIVKNKSADALTSRILTASVNQRNNSNINYGRNYNNNTKKIYRDKNGNKLIAILHAGPHKTGSTAIQTALNRTKFKTILEEEDDFALFPYNYFSANCLFPDPASPESNCPLEQKEVDEMRAFIQRATADRKHIMYSNEALELADRYNLTKLQNEFVPNHEIYVCVVYRRFYEWIVSLHGQYYRTSVDWDSWPPPPQKTHGLPPIVKWLTTQEIQKNLEENYAIRTRGRYEELFPNRTYMINYHDNPGNVEDVVTNFVCHKNTRTPHLCNAKLKEVLEKVVKSDSRALKAEEESVPSTDFNPGFSTAYDEILMAAYERNMMPADLTQHIHRQHARWAVQDYVENNILTQTDEDGKGVVLPSICLDEEVAEYLLSTSLYVEEKLYPDFFRSDRGEAALRAGFDVYRTTKLCSVDFDTMVQRYPGLKEFLWNGITQFYE